MRSQRPVNLNLLTIKFPLPAIVSILHRLSGVFTALLIPFLLWLLAGSLGTADQFMSLQDTLSSPFIKFILWLFMTALLYHLVAGIRHLLMDAGIGESLKGGRLGAYITVACAGVLSLLTGIWLW